MAAKQEKDAAGSTPPRVSPVMPHLRQVESVLQVSGEFNRLPVPITDEPQAEFAIFQTGGCVTADGSELVASVELGFRLSGVPEAAADVPEELIDKKTGRVSIAFVRASYMVTYGLDDGRSLAAADVEEFCGINGVHTAWPFWREFITSCLLRSGLESVPVPPFTVYGPQKAAVTYETNQPPAVE